jgi:tetratricopeptide (TPR) repeat protein
MSRDKKILIICMLLTASGFLAFWQVNHHDFVSYDDTLYVTENSHIQSGLTLKGIEWAFTTGHASNWHPLTWLSHMLDVQLFGLNPGWHHFINLLFHIANTVLLFLVLHRATKALWQSAFVAALFALHPLHVESVAWVAERKDVLSTFFWILTMWVYLSYTARPGIVRYLSLLLCFALGLMAKPMLVTLPFVLLLLDYWPLGRLGLRKEPRETLNPPPQGAQKRKEKGRTRTADAPARPAVSQWALIRPLLVEKVPLFVLAGLSSIVTYIAQYYGGAMLAAERVPLASRLANASISYVIYIAKMFRPANLAVLYPYPERLPLWEAAGAFAILVAFTALAIKAAKKRAYATVGWFWYLGTLVPVIGIVQVGPQALADRYTYIPLIGLFIIIAWAVPDVLKTWSHRRVALTTLSILCLLSLFGVTWRQVAYWRDSITLYTHALEVTDRNSTIYCNRGTTYGDLGNYAKAVADLDRAIEINPQLVEGYSNRGTIYNDHADFTKAIADFNKALEIDPGYAPAYYNRGAAYGNLGRNDLALSDFSKAIEIDPRYGDAYSNRGLIYSSLGDYAKALSDFNKAIEINPKLAEAYSGRGLAYGSLGDYAKALSDFSRAIEINPKLAKAYSGRGAAYGSFRNYTQAIADFSRAIEIDPRDVGAYVDRAAAYAILGKRGQAIADMRTAARLGNEGARNFLKREKIDW